MSLRPARSEDIPFIRGLTTRGDYAPFIGDSDEAQLQVWIDSPEARLVIWEAADTRGFAVFRSVGAEGGVVELVRIALDRAGGGMGERFFRALVDHAFRDLGAARLWLDASAENPRAVKVYGRLGFREEGRMRAHWYRPALGRAVDLILMGLMRDEWESLEPPSARS